MVISDYRRKVNSLLLARQQALSDVSRESKELDRIGLGIESVSAGQVLVQKIAQTIQQKVQEKISGIVNRCLAAVFDEPYTFSIEFDRKRNKTEARMVFSRDGGELDDPLNEIGGGVVDVTTFALRVACILMSRPALRRVLFLDEPWKNIRGKVYKARTRQMLEKLVKDLEFQVLLNTDIPEYQLGTVIQLEN